MDTAYYAHVPLPGGPGRLLIGICPGRVKPPEHARVVEDDVRFLREHEHTTVLVRMLRAAEIEARMGWSVGRMDEAAREAGMELLVCEIKDKWLPKKTAFVETVRAVCERLGRGETVYAFCNGGKGRSGTLCTAVLMAHGMTLDEAKQTVRTARPGTIRNPAQILWLRMARSKIAAIDAQQYWVDSSEGVSEEESEEESEEAT